jgi:hypothetical protein
MQQTTNHNYGLFKSMMRRNLDAIAMCCFARKEPIELNISTIGLIVYGGVCRRTGVVCEDSVAKAFSPERCLESWVAVGTVPFTMQCLSDPNVHHDGTNETRGTPNSTNIKSSRQKMIHLHNCMHLSAMGYTTDLLKTEEKIRVLAEEAPLSVTEANARERAKSKRPFSFRLQKA